MGVGALLKIPIDLEEEKEELTGILQHRGSVTNEIVGESSLLIGLGEVKKVSGSLLHGIIYQNSPRKVSLSSLRTSRGFYSLISPLGGSRDLLGSKPLYFSNGVFSSEKKVLWALGLEPKEVPINQLFGEKIYDLRLETEMGEETITELKSELYHVISSLIREKGKKVGIFFSGGIDSTIIAKIALDLGAKVKAFTTGMEGSEDLSYSNKVAKELGLDHIRVEISLNELEENLKDIIWSSEEVDWMQVGIGATIYFSAREMSSEGLDFALSGQGADEIFGGYFKYLSLSSNDLKRKLIEDQTSLHRDLERDEKVSAHFGIDLYFPYTDRIIVSLANSIPIELKVSNGRRKILLRELGRELSVPELVIGREKKSAQYGSKIHSAIDKIARRRGFKRSLPTEIGFNGSHVKLFLSELAKELGIPH